MNVNTLSEVLVATPLRGSSVSREYAFSKGIAVRRLDNIRWDYSMWKRFLPKQELDDLAATTYWLTASKQVQSPYDNGVELYETARRAMYAVQVICPSGCRNLYMKLHRTKGGYDHIHSHPRREMESTLIGRLTFLEQQAFEQDFEKVYEGIDRAFNERILRIRRPMLLIEHGLQAGEVELSMLFWVMALDMLFMAGGNSGKFVERISRFLGTDTLIFPPTSLRGLQPKYKVKDVLKELYRFRNVVAHGAETFISPYREEHDLVDKQGCRINHEDYHYADLMQESALFLLCRSLRRVLTDGLVDEVKDEAKWKRRLKIGASVQASKAIPKMGLSA